MVNRTLILFPDIRKKTFPCIDRPHKPQLKVTPDVSLKKRIDSIDLLKGLVMVIMALDHVRDYFHCDAYLFNPLDPIKSNLPVFFTRWSTHFCAPTFCFLAGLSAYLSGRRKPKADLSMFLVKRGIWLVLLELTIIKKIGC
ncbi:MAG TPA: heparan-alpha-glucosaminide N-acetyltransferase domain-containing protein [Flavitalea sp.]|nr:heparan-alpha-glucosaminide N-acetyltransferase domain-containing protein [Flavitalea sp.]